MQLDKAAQHSREFSIYKQKKLLISRSQKVLVLYIAEFIQPLLPCTVFFILFRVIISPQFFSMQMEQPQASGVFGNLRLFC